MTKSKKETKGTGMHPTTRHEDTNKPFKKNIWCLCIHFRLKKGKNKYSCDYFPHDCYNASNCCAYEEDTDPSSRRARNRHYNQYLERRKSKLTNISKPLERNRANSRKTIKPSIIKSKPQEKRQSTKPRIRPFKDSKHLSIPPCPKERVAEMQKKVNEVVINSEHGEGVVVSVNEKGTLYVIFKDGYDQQFVYNAFEMGYLKLK